MTDYSEFRPVSTFKADTKSVRLTDVIKRATEALEKHGNLETCFIGLVRSEDGSTAKEIEFDIRAFELDESGAVTIYGESVHDGKL